MFRARSLSPPRRGVILLVMLLLLTLFAVVGLTFVLYADAEAAASRLYRESQSPTGADLEPELLLSLFLGQLLHDVPDDETGVWSALRGHSLLRNLYGLNYVLAEDGRLVFTGDGVPLNSVPFNGTGRLHYPSPFDPGVDDYLLVNYTYHPADDFLRDPERLGPRPGLKRPGQPDNRRPFTGGVNPPYTYPDLNHLFLAAVRASDGLVLLPSFHRPHSGFGDLEPANPNWYVPSSTDPSLKYRVLRPRPVDQLLPGETWPPDRPFFPAPENAGGDVKNLIGSPGGEDSIWIDLDAPVLVARNGRKYKPLFAPLVLDLDNRVNVNVHGNIRGADRSHVSNQGWGPWEVNPRRLISLNPADPLLAARQQEWANLLVGNPTFPRHSLGRYGPDERPTSPFSGNAVPAGRAPHFYGQTDLDARQDTTAAPSTRVLPPGAPDNPNPRTFGFPFYPPASYGNGNAFERTDHPALFNALSPLRVSATNFDRRFHVSNLEALLRYGDTGTQALTSELSRLCPRNFAEAPIRRLVTTHSCDLALPGLSPWVWEPSAAPYRLGDNPASPFPEGNAHPFPALFYRGLARVPAFSEFQRPDASPDNPAVSWQARSALWGRLDPNRRLPDYPQPGNSGRIPAADLPQCRAAQRARHDLAYDLFLRLQSVTGASPLAEPGSPEFNALRWLAQLAVNMVDYIDPDDCLTPFEWAAGHWVFGTELPRVVLNEAYVEASRPAPQGPTTVKVWVELHNPLRTDPTPSDNGAARLGVEGIDEGGLYGVYQLVLCKPDDDTRYLRRFDNVLGTPWPMGGSDPNLVHKQANGQDAVVAHFGTDATTRFLQPGNGKYSGPEGGNEGFYVLGPEPLPGSAPRLTLRASAMSYQDPADGPEPPTILLRRLACPGLPPQDDPRRPDYNPYVTVDSMADVEVNRDVPQRPLDDRESFGRTQPYAGHNSLLKPQQPNPVLTGQPQHTFFRHNAGPATPGPNRPDPPATYPAFDWLVHLDRPLISPMELLHVSAFKPHELTQQFLIDVNNDGNLEPGERHRHRAPWFDQSRRLYRLFEFLETHNLSTPPQTRVIGTYPPSPGLGTAQRVQVVSDRMGGLTAGGVPWRLRPGSVLVVGEGESQETVVVLHCPDETSFVADFQRPPAVNAPVTVTGVGDRVPGKINLNTVWDVETFRALCDAQSANSFTADDVDAIFQRLLAARTPEGKPGPRDRPFRGLAAGFTLRGDAQHPNGSGIEDTLLRSDPADATGDPAGRRRLFAAVTPSPDNDHPYLRHQLLTKIFNQVTTRSNVFAVWVTVGFFEIIDDTSRPVKLGAEVGRAENRHVRHRMFAVVDRTHQATAARSTAVGDPPYNNRGPQPSFNPRNNPGLVPYFSIIE